MGKPSVLGSCPMPTIMIAEDELLIADLMAEALADGGYDICGVARSVAEAIELGERCRPDVAVIDLHLADWGSGSEIGATLRCGGRLGVLYITGSPGEAALTADDGDACLRKPFRLAELVAAVKIVERIIDADAADLPMPRGFEMLSHRPDERIPEP
jgi:two-component system, response regulator PdtaR